MHQISLDKGIHLNLSAHTNLECLELKRANFDLKRNDPFGANFAAKLRHLVLNECRLVNVEHDFLKKFSNLEKFEYRSRSGEGESFLLLKQSLSDLKNLMFLSLNIYGPLQTLDFLREMHNLVILKFNDSKIIGSIAKDTFKQLNNLEHLQIRAKKGNWMRNLINLKSLDFDDMGCDDEDAELDVDYFQYLTNLCKLKYANGTISVLASNTFKALGHLKSLSLDLPKIQQIEEQAFNGLEEELVELNLNFPNLFSLKSASLKNLGGLQKLSINGSTLSDAEIFFNLPNLLCLKCLNCLFTFEMTERTFSQQKSLKKLEIYCYRLLNLPENVFTHLNNLTHLSLRGNRLLMLTFNENSFNGLDDLRELNLYLNPLIEFNMSVLTKMTKLQRLILNPQVRNFNVDLVKVNFPNIIEIKFETID